MKKLILLSIFAILVTLSPAQTISFSGYQRSTYQHPMQINNHWDAWYINSDILPFQGEIIIHDKSFEVYFTNGQSWIATTKKKKTQYSSTTYWGVWKDDQDDTKLVITPGNIKLYSHRIINTGLSGIRFDDFECYARITTFFNTQVIK